MKRPGKAHGAPPSPDLQERQVVDALLEAVAIIEVLGLERAAAPSDFLERASRHLTRLVPASSQPRPPQTDL